MAANGDEWLRQADYDLETAEFMLRGGRRFYAAFMAHLAVEKALKGLYQRRLNQVPPKTHNLTMLLDRIGLAVAAETRLFLTDLTAAQVATRYSEDIGKLQTAFTEPRVREIIDSAQKVIAWVKTQL